MSQFWLLMKLMAHRYAVGEHVEEQGDLLYQHAKQLDLEAVAAKRASST